MKIKFNWINDLSASIVVFLVALPLCLGIALGSQVPLFSGIISGVIGGVVVGFLSQSPLSVSGPAAGLIAIVILGMQKLGSLELFLMATVIAGLFQLIFGFIKLGALGDFVPNSVIKGMLAAIGIILIMKQIPHFFGYDVGPELDENSMQFIDQQNVFYQLNHVFENISLTAFLVGFISLIILIVFDLRVIKDNKYLKLLPSPLFAVIFGAVINEYFILNNPELSLKQEHLVFLSSLTNISDIFSVIIYPDFKSIFNKDVWIVAFTIALVASIETLLCIEATDKLDKYRRRTSGNRELKAQGVGNFFAGLVGGLPITSVIVRSSANVNAGAQTKLSTILHGIWLISAIFMIPSLINKIPYASLASILIYTGFKLAKPSIIRDLYKMGLDQLLPFVITIFAIIITNLLTGIFIGILASLVFILYGNFKSSVMIINEDNYYLVRFRKDVSFLNKAMLKSELEKFHKNSSVLIDVSKCDFIDKDIIEVINDFLKHAGLKDIKVEIKKNKFHNLHKLINK